MSLLLLAGGAGVALLAVVTAGVVLFLVLNPMGLAKGTAPTAAGVLAPPPKTTSPNPPSGPTKPKGQPTTAGSDRRWVAEARQEFLDALMEKERRMSAAQIRLGSLSKADFELGKEALKGIQADGFDNASEEMIRRAEAIAPETIAAYERERVVNSRDYPDLVRNGVYPQYHPTAKREELYAEFATAVGDKTKWSVSRPFAALPATEMDELMEGVRRLKDGGFGGLTKSQRLLLLKARALDFFESHLPKQ